MPADVQMYSQERQGRLHLDDEWETGLKELGRLYRPPVYTRAGCTQVLLASVLRQMVVEATNDERVQVHDPEKPVGQSCMKGSRALEELRQRRAADKEERKARKAEERGSQRSGSQPVLAEYNIFEVNFSFSGHQSKHGTSCAKSRDKRIAVIEAAQSSMPDFERAWEALITHFEITHFEKRMPDTELAAESDAADAADTESDAEPADAKAAGGGGELSGIAMLCADESTSRNTYEGRMLHAYFICISALAEATAAGVLLPEPTASAIPHFRTALSSDSCDFMSVPSAVN